MPAMPKAVLFLCSGNYYRSRHAEAVFNHRAAAAGLDVSGDTVKPTAIDSTCFESRHVSGHFERRRRQSDRAAAKGAKGGRPPQKSGRGRPPTAAGRGR